MDKNRLEKILEKISPDGEEDLPISGEVEFKVFDENNNLKQKEKAEF